MADVTDGTSNTLLLAESAGRDPLYQMGKFISLSGGGRGSWGNPGNVINLTGFNPTTNSLPGPCAANCTNNNEIYSFHPGTATVLFCDATVRTMRANVPLQIVSDLITRADGETVNLGRCFDVEPSLQCQLLLLRHRFPAASCCSDPVPALAGLGWLGRCNRPICSPPRRLGLTICRPKRGG